MGREEGQAILYLKAPDQTHGLEPPASWGAFTRYVEIGDDLYAVRHVDVFANGYALSYDRVHWVDELGMLGDMRYDEKKWTKWWGAALEITPEEFEAVWRSAEESPARPIQLRGEKTSEMGVTPVWLARLKGG